MLFVFQTKTPVSNLVLKFDGLGRQTQGKPENIDCLSIFTTLLWYLTVMQTPLLCIQTILLLFELLVSANVLLNGHTATQNYVFVVFQLELTKTNPMTNLSNMLGR